MHEHIKGIPNGQHTHVLDILTGAYNLCPPTPQYSNTWKVSTVIACLDLLSYLTQNYCLLSFQQKQFNYCLLQDLYALANFFLSNIPWAIQIRATTLFPLTTTIILKKSMKNNITQRIMLTNPHWAMAAVKKMVSKLVHHAAAGAANIISRREYWNSKPVPKRTHQPLPGHGKVQRN